MKLSVGIQESLVTILCFGSLGDSGIVKSLIPVGQFDAYYRDIAEACVDYQREYSQAPGEHTLDIIDSLKARSGDKGEFYEKIFQSMLACRQGLNTSFVLGKAREFARSQKYKTSAIKIVEALEKDTGEGLDDAEKVFREALDFRANTFDSGIWLSKPSDVFAALSQEDIEPFPTGIPELDRIGAGPSRKTLHVFQGLPNRGKSWWLGQLGKMARLNRLRVCHVTCEMSARKVMLRYLQSFFSLTRTESEVTYRTFELGAKGRLKGLNEEVIDSRLHLLDPKIKQKLKPKLGLLKMPFVIKEFPTSTLTVNDLESYLDTLGEIDHFTPDLLIVDYADLFKKDQRDYRHSLQQIYEDLRGVAVKRNCAVATATQANRGSLKVKLVDEGGAAEDFSKVATADVYLTYSQTEEEKALGLARLFVAKHRDEANRQIILISQAYAMGQFCMDSMPMTKSYWDYVKEATGEEDGVEDDRGSEHGLLHNFGDGDDE
jgi:hypothetical protein